MEKKDWFFIFLIILALGSGSLKMSGISIPTWIVTGLIISMMLFAVFYLEEPIWIIVGAVLSFAVQWGIMAFFCQTWNVSAYFENGGPILGFIAFFMGLMMDPGGRKKDRLDKKINAFLKAGGVAGLLFMLITTGAY